MSFLNHLLESRNTYQGKKVTLNKPFRTPDGPKKFSVYVKNDKGNVVKVNFGDPDMGIKRDNDERRKSFRARHNCDNPGPKWKARYWSCRMWEKNKSVSDLTEMASQLDESNDNTEIIEDIDFYSLKVDGSLTIKEENFPNSLDPYILLSENIKLAESGTTGTSLDPFLCKKIDALVDYIMSRGAE